MNMRKKSCLFLASVAVLPLICVLIFILYLRLHTFTLFPAEKYNANGWWPDCNGESVVHFLRTGERMIELEYTLKGIPAYAGISIFLEQDYPFLDLSKYRMVSLRLSAFKAKHVGLIIQTFEKGITRMENGNFTPLRFSQLSKEIREGQETYTFPLESLKVPDWWITLYAERGKELEPDPFGKSVVFQLFFDDPVLLEQRNRLEVYEITFHSGPDHPLAIVIGLCSGYYLLSGFFLLFARYKKNIDQNQEKLLSARKRVHGESGIEKETETLKAYIAEGYTNPDLSLQLVAEETGMSQQRINSILQKEYAMKFKTCINWLRLQEAKRLLIETSLSVTEIAFGLGFNSSSYFGLIFKKHEGLTPGEYREKNRLSR